MKEYDSHNEKVLIIGAGAAGAMAAITMKENGLTPLVVSKREYGDAHTIWARGGINASLANLDKEDNWAIHAADTLDEGHFINNPDAVESMTSAMPDIIGLLEEWGTGFSKTEDGLINQRYFGAQSYRRTCFVGDFTGEALLNTLIEKAKSLEIPYRDGVFITELISDGKKVEGAVGYDMESNEKLVILADKVILAAGGHTSIYNRHSSRDEENTGDGVSLAFKAGAEVMDMEFIQFHPTGMVGEKYGERWDGRLVTEAVRGEGGRLYNSKGERFMQNYSPEQMELDARDVVSRAIYNEIKGGRGTENDGVYLDISHKSKDFIKDRLPRMYERFEELGTDISKNPMEVSPTAHYAMGGVKYNPETGETNIENLHVIGETTAGIHGANRLGGNSLAETVSIGRIVGEHISELNLKEKENTDIEFREELEFLDSLENREEEISPEEFISKIRNIMEEHAGIIRNEETIQKGLNKLNKINYKDVEIDSEKDKTSEQYMKALNAKFMLDAAKMTLRGALIRKESRGAHYREDFKSKREKFSKNIIYKMRNGEIKTSFEELGEPSEEVKREIDEEHNLDYHHLE